MQVERNLASGAKNLFMAHTLVAEQVLTPLQPQSVAMLLLMSLSAVDCCCYCFFSSCCSVYSLHVLNNQLLLSIHTPCLHITS